MNITCHNCQSKLNIPDDKLPKDKEALIRCPKCKEKIQIPAAIPYESVEEKKLLSKLPLENGSNALICIDRSDLKQKVSSSLDQMGINTDIAIEMRAALKKMEYTIYNLLLLEDEFDRENNGAAGIIDRVNAIDTSMRRRTCIVLINQKFNTNDNMAALHSSVNNVIHQDDIHHMESFLSKALADHKNLYSIYNESLKLVGKA